MVTLSSSPESDAGIPARIPTPGGAPPLPAPGWLHTNLRNILMIGIVGMVCWMAWQGNDQAQSALIAAFAVLVGMIFGERAALKRPGADS